MSAMTGDLAGVAYWDEVWSAPAKAPFDPDALANRSLAALLRRFLARTPSKGLIVEAGCGDSVVTPFIAARGYQTAGIDYSLAGCDRFRRNCQESAVYHADVFAPPNDLLGAADGLFSLGLVEHFADTQAVIAALAKLVRPGGHILTVVPNMHGTVGRLQKLLNRAAFDVHVPLTPDELRAAHDMLEVIETGYLGSMSYGVINPGQSWVSRMAVGALARISLGIMACEKLVPIPPGRLFSPYSFCIARVPQG